MMGVLAVLGAGVIGRIIFAYNRLVRLRNQVLAAWADIDVQLVRRHDLVPQLVAWVRFGSSRHATMNAGRWRRSRQSRRLNASFTSRWEASAYAAFDLGLLPAPIRTVSTGAFEVFDELFGLVLNRFGVHGASGRGFDVT